MSWFLPAHGKIVNATNAIIHSSYLFHSLSVKHFSAKGTAWLTTSLGLKTNMQPFHLAANLSFLFQDQENLLDRYETAKHLGFRGVEVAFPYDYPIEKLVDAKTKAGVEQVLINSWPGDLKGGELGLAAIPGREQEFIDTLETSINYAKALKCSKIHIVAGKIRHGHDNNLVDLTYEKNIEAAVERLAKENIDTLIEPISNFAVPFYHMNSYTKAINLIDKIKSPHLKLQVDIYHLQLLLGNLTHNLQEWMPFIGHIQIAQVPHRHEPNTPGEVNFKYLFQLLTELKYNGWVGCEYKPKGEGMGGMGWIKECEITL